MQEARLIDANVLHAKILEENRGNFSATENVAQILLRIETAPTIEAEPVRHGRWIPVEYDSYADGAPVWDKYECSECSHEHNGEENTLTTFCPDCGARMDVDEIAEIEVEPVQHHM